MGFLSIFPESYATVETWLTRIFVSSMTSSRLHTLTDLYVAVPGHLHYWSMGRARHLRLRTLHIPLRCPLLPRVWRTRKRQPQTPRSEPDRATDWPPPQVKHGQRARRGRWLESSTNGCSAIPTHNRREGPSELWIIEHGQSLSCATSGTVLTKKQVLPLTRP